MSRREPTRPMKLLAYLFVFALAAVFFSGVIWVIVQIWRSILGG